MLKKLTKESTRSLYKTLKELGLSEYEQKLYAVSLNLGPSPVAKLAEHLGVSRPNIYKVIEGLEKHGLATFSTKSGYSKLFMVDSPSKVTELLRKKRDTYASIDKELTAIVPDLIALYKQGDLPTKIKIIQAQEDLFNAFEQVFEEAQDEIKYLGSSKDLNAFVSYPRLEKQIKKRIKRGVRTKLLVFPDEDAIEFKKRDMEELRETRFLENADPFVTGFYLFANKVIIWQPKAPLAVLIEDEYIVAMLKSIYGILWKSARKDMPEVVMKQDVKD